MKSQCTQCDWVFENEDEAVCRQWGEAHTASTGHAVEVG